MRADVEFLLPASRQYPFDEVCRRVVVELQKRDFRVPGLEVTFDRYGTGEQRMGMVRSVSGVDFRLRFGRVQRQLPGGRYRDVAACSAIGIPRREIRVYDDESGPDYYLYVGEDWERDRDRFFDGPKIHGRLHGEPRTYLRYEGGCDCDRGPTVRHSHSGRRPPLLLWDSDLDREHEPEGDDPVVLSTAVAMQEFRAYLEDVVLPQIERVEPAARPCDPFASAEIPVPSWATALFCFADYQDVRRIRLGRTDLARLPAFDRFGMSPEGRRLVPVHERGGDLVTELARGRFRWCGIGEVADGTPRASVVVPGHDGMFEPCVVRVRLDRSNDVYVADEAAYERWSRETSSSGTSAPVADQIRDCLRARARTMVPLASYDGGFERPVVLVGRELGLHEVELVGDSGEVR